MSFSPRPNEQVLSGDWLPMQMEDTSEIVFTYLRRAKEINIKLSQNGGPPALLPHILGLQAPLILLSAAEEEQRP